MNTLPDKFYDELADLIEKYIGRGLSPKEISSYLRDAAESPVEFVTPEDDYDYDQEEDC